MYSTNLTTCVLFSTIYTFCIICNNTFKIMIFSPNSFTSKGMRNSTVRNESRKLIKQIQIHVHSRPLHIVKTFKAGRREKHVATILNVNNLVCLLIFFSLKTLISLLNSSISVTCDPSVTNNSRNTFWSVSEGLEVRDALLLDLASLLERKEPR